MTMIRPSDPHIFNFSLATLCSSQQIYGFATQVLEQCSASLDAHCIPFFMPPFLLLKFLFFLKRSIYSEKVSGKVVLITGVSSEIGKVSISVTPSNLCRLFTWAIYTI